MFSNMASLSWDFIKDNSIFSSHVGTNLQEIEMS